MKYLALIALIIVAAILLNRKKVKEVIKQIADASKTKIDQASEGAQNAVDKIADKGASILPVDLNGTDPMERIRRPVTPDYVPKPLPTQMRSLDIPQPIPQTESPIPYEIVPSGGSGAGEVTYGRGTGIKRSFDLVEAQ